MSNLEELCEKNLNRPSRFKDFNELGDWIIAATPHDYLFMHAKIRQLVAAAEASLVYISEDDKSEFLTFRRDLVSPVWNS